MTRDAESFESRERDRPKRGDAEYRRAEARVRGELISPGVRRHAWLDIVAPLGALFIGAFLAVFYYNPIKVVRWVQSTELGWSGVTRNEIGLADGVMTYYVSGGYSGMEPVVMIHGLGPNAALVWRRVMPILAAGHYKLIAPNLYGFASSEHRQVVHSIAYQARALQSLIDQMKLEHVNLIGWDLGADIALYYAVDHPDTVERLVLVSGGLFGYAGAVRLRRAMLSTSIEAMQKQADESFFGLPPMPDFMYQRMVAALALDAPAATEMLNSIPRDEAHIRARLGRIFNTLTVVSWGGRDPYFNGALGSALHSALPGSATIVFKTSRHYPQLEHPKEFSDAMLFVLKQTEGGQ
jgi:pimeloyl-ACP methyl ester carboxylesterase